MSSLAKITVTVITGFLGFSGASAAKAFWIFCTVSPKRSGNSPVCTRSNSVFWLAAACRLVQASSAGRPRCPILRQASRIGAGISKGG